MQEIEELQFAAEEERGIGARERRQPLVGYLSGW
jgi:hypothetical protein